MKKILMLGTGGTIASELTPEGLTPELTPEQLHAVINAPLLSGAKNQNRARNPGDPSSNVRAGAFAQP